MILVKTSSRFPKYLLVRYNSVMQPKMVKGRWQHLCLNERRYDIDMFAHRVPFTVRIFGQLARPAPGSNYYIERAGYL